MILVVRSLQARVSGTLIEPAQVPRDTDLPLRATFTGQSIFWQPWCYWPKKCLMLLITIFYNPKTLNVQGTMLRHPVMTLPSNPQVQAPIVNNPAF
ncbi:hypothetical protein TIFTF001_029454 [Ficus carica]|uniref:Uncharacterized protein n=1 Tax=Ficus carica TaxID=3494 RepID=A0AA88J3E7_FICCA|nr:hypothetical protein TIFTF001_029454 [Ficus carica]